MNATSTITMSAYSVLATNGPSTRAELLAAFEVYYFQATPEELDEALAVACERGWVVDVNGVFSALGPMGWIVVARDRKDPDGWEGWVCQNVRTAQKRPFEELLKGES